MSTQFNLVIMRRLFSFGLVLSIAVIASCSKESSDNNVRKMGVLKKNYVQDFGQKVDDDLNTIAQTISNSGEHFSNETYVVNTGRSYYQNDSDADSAFVWGYNLGKNTPQAEDYYSELSDDVVAYIEESLNSVQSAGDYQEALDLLNAVYQDVEGDQSLAVDDRELGLAALR